MAGGSTITKFVAIDCETSGMAFEGDDPSVGYQMVSLAMIISNVKDFKEYEKFYVEIKWNGESKWNDKAEEIHGMSKAYLEANGVDEDEAALQAAEFLSEHFNSTKPITLCGHNAANFDKPFLKSLLRKIGVNFKFSHRTIDSFSVGLVALGAFDSDELFDKMGFEKRDEHNALVDIQMTLKSIRVINKLIKASLE